MRTTIRIDDDLLKELRVQSRRQKTSLNRFLNHLLRLGLKVGDRRPGTTVRHREKAISMGRPTLNLDKALAIAAALEDEQVLGKLADRK